MDKREMLDLLRLLRDKEKRIAPLAKYEREWLEHWDDGKISRESRALAKLYCKSRVLLARMSDDLLAGRFDPEKWARIDDLWAQAEGLPLVSKGLRYGDTQSSRAKGQRPEGRVTERIVRAKVKALRAAGAPESEWAGQIAIELDSTPKHAREVMQALGLKTKKTKRT